MPAARRLRTPALLPLYREMVVTGAWWDHVDEVAHLVGELLLGFPAEVRPVVLGWSREPDRWLRRVSIICQLGARDRTDVPLLTDAVVANLADPDPFLRKAIGWALRDLARTEPARVRSFVASHADQLSALSRREALKHLGGAAPPHPAAPDRQTWDRAGMPATDIDPDSKDWTWVLDRPCPECGFVAGDVDPAELADRIRAGAEHWQGVLRRPDVRGRPRPGVWSPLEYGCHVRDVHRTMAGRVRLMLDEDAPTFADWDQDAAAVAERYAEQDPVRASGELAAAAEAAAELYAGVSGSGWDRPGQRSNGSRFTVASLGRYHLHDVVHHLHDVGPG